jgi:hypothetical protein
VKSLGSDAVVVQADLQDTASGKILVEAALKSFNVDKIDILGMQDARRYLRISS